MNWDDVVRKVSPYVVKIETPNGHGTGFVYMHDPANQWCAIATADHVIGYADDWQLPIKIHTETQTRFLNAQDRVIFRKRDTDSAVMLFVPQDTVMQHGGIALSPNGLRVNIGADVGWLGFPSIAPTNLCFFSGNISAYSANRATGEALPGLAIAQDISYFHDVTIHINSMQEAQKRKAEFEAGAPTK